MLVVLAVALAVMAISAEAMRGGMRIGGNGAMGGSGGGTAPVPESNYDGNVDNGGNVGNVGNFDGNYDMSPALLADVEASITDEWGLGCTVSSDKDLTIFGETVSVGDVVTRTLSGVINDPPVTMYWQAPYWSWYPPEGIYHPTGYFIRTETVVPDESYRISIVGDHKGPYPGAAGYVQIYDPFTITEVENNASLTGIETGRITFHSKGGCPFCGACDGGRINISVIVEKRGHMHMGGDYEPVPTTTTIDECIPNPDGACTLQYDPVCGVDGNTYSNECFAGLVCVDIAYSGACVTTTPPPGNY